MESKPREFWVADQNLGDDVALAKGTYFCSSSRPSEQDLLNWPGKFIHAIEISAYQKLEAELSEKIALIESLNRQVVEMTGKYEYWKRALCSSTPNSYYQKVLDDETKS